MDRFRCNDRDGILPKAAFRTNSSCRIMLLSEPTEAVLERFMSLPQAEALEQALAAAGEAHHDFEQVVLEGERDRLWAGFYAAFVLGRLGDFAASSTLSRLLEDTPSGDEWPQRAAAHVIAKLGG